MPMLSHRERLILLNLVPDIGSLRLRKLLEHFGTLERLWQARSQDLEQVNGIGPGLAKQLLDGIRNERALDEELALAQREGVSILTLYDANYPNRLKEIYDPPLALYVRGGPSALDEASVAIVGSRRASLYGLEVAERLAYDLALRGVAVVSGVARGIDGAAHRGALKAHGRTVGVLGGGFCRFYPTEHESLAKQMAEHGAVISEYPMRMAPLAQNFPRRNRVISGLSLGVVIVEAAQRSGALITADCALEQGREVFAVPGPITTATSQGTHHLLQQGARLVTSVDDILEELRLDPPPRRDRPPQAGVRQTAATRLPETEQRVFACVEADPPRYIDAIVAQSGLAAPEVSSALLQLELKRFIRQLPGKQFIRKSDAVDAQR